MADGKWVMTEEDAKRVDLTFSGSGYRSFKCRSCGGTTDFVYKDEIERYFSAEAMDAKETMVSCYGFRQRTGSV